MAYGSRSKIKDHLGIESTETRFDDELDDLLDKASNYINSMLLPYTSIPITDSTGLINNIADDLAIGMWNEKKASLRGDSLARDPATKRALDALKSFIQGTYSGGGPGEGRRELMRKVDYETIENG